MNLPLILRALSRQLHIPIVDLGHLVKFTKEFAHFLLICILTSQQCFFMSLN